MSRELTCNVNAKELCRALRSMLDMNQMNASLWIQASDTPLEFIKFVDDHWADIQADFEKSVRTFAVYPRFVKQNSKIDSRGGPSFTNKIGFIKMLRSLAGWGLADSKEYVESLPREFKEFYFSSLEEAKESKFAKACNEMAIDVEWIRCDDVAGLRHWSTLASLTLV